MKKIKILYVICFLIMASFICETVAAAQAPCVNDMAGYLTDSQEAELTKRLESIRQKYNFDVAFVSEVEMSGYSAQSTADDIYDYQGYGLGTNDSGILFYICKSTREYHYSTHAKGVEIFTDSRLEYLDNEVISFLRNDDYYGACMRYADIAEDFIKNPNGGVSKKIEIVNYIRNIGLAAAASLIMAFLLTAAKKRQMNTVAKQKTANSYITDGGLDITYSRDIYLYSHVSKRAKPKNNSSGGGSSTHRSSSGRSHGGRGGRF